MLSQISSLVFNFSFTYYIDNQLKEGWRIKIVIVASKGKEAFYEKLGFKARPNDNDGPGMDMWRE